MRVEDIKICGIESISSKSKFDGFGVSCDRCDAGNALYHLSGDLPPNISGYYCGSCHKVVCKEASNYYRLKLEEKTKNIKITIIFCEKGWFPSEINILGKNIEEGVWSHPQYRQYLIIVNFHVSPNTISKHLDPKKVFNVKHVVGMYGLPFLPID